MYNTDTAKLLGTYEYGNGCGDFNHILEELYQKKTGEFFLYGSGGPKTSYCVRCGSSTWSGSSRITPYSVAEAKEWAMENLTGDEYEEIFGEVEE